MSFKFFISLAYEKPKPNQKPVFIRIIYIILHFSHQWYFRFVNSIANELPDDDRVPIAVSYDMMWPKRGNGRSYDSNSGKSINITRETFFFFLQSH